MVRREISEILHTRYRSESVGITITEVKVANDLRNARVFYSVLGSQDDAQLANSFLKNRVREIRYLLAGEWSSNTPLFSTSCMMSPLPGDST